MKIPRIITEQYPQGLGSTVSDIILEVKQTPLAPYHIFSKTKFSMLIDDIKKLLEQYKSEGRTQVILFGMETHACIMQTTLDLLVEGMEVHIAVDACMSLRYVIFIMFDHYLLIRNCRSYDRDIGLDRLKSEGAVVHTAEGIVFDLIRDSKHEKFRELATLIKDIKLNPWENY